MNRRRPCCPKSKSAGSTADGDYRFTDRSLEPNVSMAIDHFSGSIGGLSSTNPEKADVDLKALVDGSGPVAITGKLIPWARASWST